MGSKSKYTIYSTDFNTNLLNLYQEFIDEYNNLKLVSNSKGFFKAIVNAVNFKFDGDL